VRALFLAALLAVASCGRDNLNPPIRPNPPILGNEIVFTSNRGADGLMDLYASNADGTGFHRLTSDSSYDGESRWSPDGTKIAFVHGNGDSLNVFVMNADGTNRTRLTNRYEVRGPCWSPDGSQIAYQSGHSYGQGNPNQLWVMDADGTAPHVVIDYDSLNGANQISWTPRNTFLGVDGFNLLEFDADGKNKRQIMPLRLYSFEVFPRMSPDGTKVLGIEIDHEGASAVAWKIPALDEDWKQRMWDGNCTRSDPAIACARAQDLLAYGYDQPPAVHVRRLSDGVLLWRDDRPPQGRDLSGRGLVFSHAGDRLYAVTQYYATAFKHIVTAYDAANGAVLWEHDAGKDIARVLVTPDDTTVIALFRTVQLLRASDGKLLAERPVPVEKQVIQAYAISPVGELFIGGDGFAELIDVASGDVVDRWTFTAKRFATCATFSADGTRLFIGTNAAAIYCYERR